MQLAQASAKLHRASEVPIYGSRGERCSEERDLDTNVSDIADVKRERNVAQQTS